MDDFEKMEQYMRYVIKELALKYYISFFELQTKTYPFCPVQINSYQKENFIYNMYYMERYGLDNKCPKFESHYLHKYIKILEFDEFKLKNFNDIKRNLSR